jgi:ribosomal protein S18 acetylase RimI-like enzyme
LKECATAAAAADISPAVAADATEIGDLYLVARNDALPFLRRVHSDEQVRAWIADVLLKKSRVWVARREQRMVGFLALNHSELEQLYVLPGHYRSSVGSSLLEIAKAESSDQLFLFTFQRNERARAFYEAHGFCAVDWNDGSRNEEHEPDVRYQWTAAI